MNCNRCEENLTSLADDALSARARARTEAHLATCAACRRVYDELRMVKRLLGDLRAPEAEPGFWDHTFERLATAIERRRRATTMIMRARLAGASAAAAILAIAIMRIPAGESPEAHETAGAPAVAAQATFDPSALVSMHASMRAGEPLADAGKVRFAIGEGHARDYASDERFDSL